MFVTGLQVTGLSDPVTVGDSLTVTCSFDLDSTSIEWLYDNEVVLTTTSSLLPLSFGTVNDTVNNRQYTCRVVTPYGTQEETITIRVQGKQQT